MIVYVDRLLVHWAQELSVRGVSVNLGYRPGWSGAALIDAGRKTSRKLTARGSATLSSKSSATVGKVAERVNQSVERLPCHLQKIVRVHYLDGPWLSSAQKSDVIGISVRKYYRDLHAAHAEIGDELPDSYANWKLRK